MGDLPRAWTYHRKATSPTPLVSGSLPPFGYVRVCMCVYVCTRVSVCGVCVLIFFMEKMDKK